jgi:hypothetical protein
MPIEELTFVYTVIEAQDRLYEFWLTGTFAVIIAAHFTSERMSKQLFALLIITYISFAVATMLRFLATNARLSDAQDLIREIDPGAVNSFAAFAVASIPISFLIGTVGTIFYLVSSYRKNRTTVVSE